MSIYYLHENCCGTCKHWQCPKSDRHASYEGTMYVNSDDYPHRCNNFHSCKYETNASDGSDCAFHESVSRPTEVGLLFEWDDEATERVAKEKAKEQERKEELLRCDVVERETYNNYEHYETNTRNDDSDNSIDLSEWHPFDWIKFGFVALLLMAMPFIIYYLYFRK